MPTIMETGQKHRKKEKRIEENEDSEDSKKIRNLDLMLTQLCTLDLALKKNSKLKRERDKGEKTKKVRKKKDDTREKSHHLADGKHRHGKPHVTKHEMSRPKSKSPRPNAVLNFEDLCTVCDNNDNIKALDAKVSTKRNKEVKTKDARGSDQLSKTKGDVVLTDLDQVQLSATEQFASNSPRSVSPNSSLEKRAKKSNKTRTKKKKMEPVVQDYSNEDILRDQVSVISIGNDDEYDLIKKAFTQINSENMNDNINKKSSKKSKKHKTQTEENNSDSPDLNGLPEGLQLSQIRLKSQSNSKSDLTDIQPSHRASFEIIQSISNGADVGKESCHDLNTIGQPENDAEVKKSEDSELNTIENLEPFRVIKIKSSKIRLDENRKNSRKKKMSTRQRTEPASNLTNKNKQTTRPSAIVKQSTNDATLKAQQFEISKRKQALPLAIGTSKTIHKEREKYSATKKKNFEQNRNQDINKYDNYHNSAKVSSDISYKMHQRKENKTNSDENSYSRNHDRLRHHRNNETRQDSQDFGVEGFRYESRRRAEKPDKHVTSQKARKSTKNESRTKTPALKIDRVINVANHNNRNYQHSKPVTSSKRNGLTDTLSWHQKANDAPSGNMTSRPERRSNKTTKYRSENQRSLSNSTTSTSFSSVSYSSQSSGSNTGSSNSSENNYSPERRDKKYRPTKTRQKSSSDSTTKNEPRSLNEKKKLEAPKYKRSNSSSSSFYPHSITVEETKHKKENSKKHEVLKSRQQRRIIDENSAQEKPSELKFGARRKPRSKGSIKGEGEDGQSLWQHQQLVVVSQKPDVTKSDRDFTKGQAAKQAYKPASSFNANSDKRSLTIRDLYSLHNVLSDTQNGTVISGYRRNDGMRVAIKRISKVGTTRWGWLGGKVVPLELALLCQVNEIRCSGVVEIVEWHETSEAFLLVMVRPHPAVDLYDYVSKHKRVKESLARHIIRKVVEALLHCITRGVLHRDVKLENVLFNPESLDITLIDFGCGDYVRNGPYKEFAGTPEYYAPEWFTRKQYNGEAMTVWSVGILLYSLLCGSLPFRSSKDITEKEILKFPSDVTQGSRDLISEMLTKNPKERIQLNSVLSHYWFHKMKKRST